MNERNGRRTEQKMGEEEEIRGGRIGKGMIDQRNRRGDRWERKRMDCEEEKEKRKKRRRNRSEDGRRRRGRKKGRDENRTEEE